jgi:hypothetical protein
MSAPFSKSQINRNARILNQCVLLVVKKIAGFLQLTTGEQNVLCVKISRLSYDNHYSLNTARLIKNLAHKQKQEMRSELSNESHMEGR